MQEKIYFNQKAIVEHNINLKVKDLAIIDAIEERIKTIQPVYFEGLTYFEVSHEYLIESLPLLKINTKSGIIKRVKRIEREGIFLRHPNCDELQKTYYTFGPKYRLLCH
jgi:hypothetical protein